MTTQPDDTQDDESGPKGLREALDRANAKIAEAEARANTAESRLMQSAFSELGLDPTLGIGKAVAKLYDGEADVEAIRKYAETEFGYKAPASDAATVVHQAQDRVDAVLQTGAPAPATAEGDVISRIQKAEADGDWVTAMQLKMDRFASTKK